MIISHIALKNWRNFQSVNVDLRDRVFLVGPNACGKSNFLDSLRFLRDLAKAGGGLQKAAIDRGGVSKIRSLSARRYPEVEIEIHLSDSNAENPLWRYGLGIKQRKGGKNEPIVAYERVWKGDRQIVDRPTQEDNNDELRLTQTYLEQINANAEFREISKFLESILYLHLIPQLVRHPEAFATPGLSEDPFGRTFLERVAKTPEKTRKSRLKKIEDALKLAVPQLKNLTDTKDVMGVPHLEAVYEHWRPRAGKQREDQFSDGTLRLIGLLWSLLETDSLLLLEEPEISLNAAIVSNLPSLIYRLQRPRKRQVIISTHSADLLSDKGIGGEEVLLMTPTHEGTQVKLASSDEQIKMLLEGGLSIADAALPLTAPPAIEQLSLFK
ncbi:MAG TPA: chromosome segregation protein SMC [Microcoleaceae bacterium UBA11344]|nr:chromosome segregation protein SMC [Microcoleaceae cyanobacterium UBA11344]